MRASRNQKQQQSCPDCQNQHTRPGSRITAEGVLRGPAAPRRQGPTFGVDGGDALGGADVPDADGLVPGRRDEEVGVAGVPAELIHAVPVPPVVVLLHLGEEDGYSMGERALARSAHPRGTASYRPQHLHHCFNHGPQPPLTDTNPGTSPHIPVLSP